MKNKKIFFLTNFILSFLFSSLLFGQGYVNISQTNKLSELPFVLALPNGEVMVAWEEAIGSFNLAGVIWYKTYTEEKGWSTAKIAAQKKYCAAFPQLAVDNNGTVHMAYMDGAGSGNREIYYKKYVNNNWSASEMVYYSPVLNSSWPRIQVEGNKIYVLWCHNYSPPGAPEHKLDVVLIEKTNGGSWPSTYQNISKHSNSVSVHPFFQVKNGNVYAIWMDDNHQPANWNIYYNERINGYCGNPIRLNPGSNQYTPALAVDNNESVHVIYTNKVNPIWYQKKSGSGWSSPKQISTQKTSQQSMLFMKYSMGLLHGVWRQREGDGNYMYYGRGTTSGNWDTPIKVSHGGQSEYPGLDVDSQGRVHIVYSDIGMGGDRDVFYVRLDQLTTNPVASFTAMPTNGDPPLYVNFDASESYDPDGNIVSYEWDFGDGNQDTGINTSHTYTNRGVRTATLTVTDNDENSSSSSQEIIIGTPPVANFSASPTAGASPLTVNFDASESYDPDGNIVSFHWDFGDSTSGSGKTPTHTYTSLATRTAILTVTDDEGLTDQASIEIEISSNPIAIIKYSPKTGESPLKVDFDASNSKPANKKEGSVEKYEWDFGDGKSGFGKKISHTFTRSKTFTVTLEITDDQGINNSTTVDVEVYSKPVASFSCSTLEGIAPIKISFNASESSDEDGTISIYKWLFGDGTIGYGKTVAHTYTTGGSFKITLTVIDNDGWTGTATQIIKIIEKPYPPLNLTLKHIVNNGLFFTDYINLLEWQNNNKNTGKIKPAKYLIYCKKENSNQGFIYIGKVDNNIFKFEILNLSSEEDMKSYIYGIRTLDWQGRESEMRKVKSSSSSSSTLN